ncbi:MAG: hypothetical protein ACP5NZ_00745, partial [Nanobdellota archaeon]
YTDYAIYDDSGTLYFTQSLSGTTNTRMVIEDITGEVGIGTSSPTAKLEINNSLAFTHNVSGDTAGIHIGSMPAQPGGLSGSAATLIRTYGHADDALILYDGYSSDAGGIKITDDGVAIWGSSDDDLFRLIDEDGGGLRLAVTDTGNLNLSANINLTMNGGNQIGSNVTCVQIKGATSILEVC